MNEEETHIFERKEIFQKQGLFLHFTLFNPFVHEFQHPPPYFLVYDRFYS